MILLFSIEINDLSQIDTRKREIKGIVEAMNYFNLENGIIITADYEEDLVFQDKFIKIIPAFKVMLEGLK